MIGGWRTRPYGVRLGDHAQTVVLQDADETEAYRLAKTLSTETPGLRVHVICRGLGIVCSYEAGAKVTRC